MERYDEQTYHCDFNLARIKYFDCYEDDNDTRNEEY